MDIMDVIEEEAGDRSTRNEPEGRDSQPASSTASHGRPERRVSFTPTSPMDTTARLIGASRDLSPRSLSDRNQEDRENGRSIRFHPPPRAVDSSSVDGDLEDFASEDFQFEERPEDASGSFSELYDAQERRRGLSLRSYRPLQRSKLELLKSSYSNYGEDGKHVRITLTAGPDVPPEQSMHTVFRWIHLQSDIPDFGVFSDECLHGGKLNQDEIAMIRRIAKRVKKENEKLLFALNPSGGRYMREFAAQELHQEQPTLSYLNKKVTMISLPHFLLDDSHDRPRLHFDTEHPPLTLLQSESTSASPDHDLQQAVRNITGSGDDRIFYVARLWCFILNDDLLVTCSQAPEQSLSGDSIAISKHPTHGTPFIKVIDGGNCLWQLGLQECQTWLGFTSHFMEISSASADIGDRFEDHYVVYMLGQSVTSANWAQVVGFASDRIIELVLLRKFMGVELISDDRSMSDDSSVTSEVHDDLAPEVDQVEPPSREVDPAVLSAVDDDLENFIAARFSTPQDASPNESPTVPDTQIFEPQQSERPKSNASKPHYSVRIQKPQDSVTFHAFHWAAVRESTTEESAKFTQQEPGNTQKIIDYLINMNQSLSRWKVYQHCPEHTLQAATRFLLRATYEEKIDGYHNDMSILERFFKAATQVFELFLPVGSDATVAKKYWGSVYSIMRNFSGWQSHRKEVVDRQFESMFHVTENFERLAELASVIQYDLSDGRGPLPGEFALPIEFKEAFMQCLLYLARHRNRKESMVDRHQHAGRCRDSLRRARRSVWKAVVGTHISTKEIVPPTALLSLIIKNALYDIGKDTKSLDIVDVYDQYYKQLDAEVRSARMKRVYRSKIVRLQQELAAVSMTLHRQGRVLQEFYTLLEQQSTGWSSIHSDILDDVPKREMIVIQEGINHVSNRAKVIADITEDVAALETYLTHEMILTKDRHDNAIYAFTIVTVIFLPLSFVCSFLGMNTADVRNMQSGQWIFWAAGIPLTVTIIILTLLWTNELKHLVKTARDYVQKRRSARQARRKKKATSEVADGTLRSLPMAATGVAMASALPRPRGKSKIDPFQRSYRKTPTFKLTPG